MDSNPATGTYLVTWRDATGGQNSGNIKAQLIASNGEMLGDALSITNLASLQRGPAVAANANDPDYLVTWVDHRNNATSDSDIYTQVIRMGSLFGPNQPINIGPGQLME